MLTISYEIRGSEANSLSAEEKHAKLAFQRAKHIKAIFDLMKLANVEEHYLSCDTIEPHGDLSRALRDIGHLGSEITEGLWNEIDCLEVICENVTTFVMTEEVEDEQA